MTPLCHLKVKKVELTMREKKLFLLSVNAEMMTVGSSLCLVLVCRLPCRLCGTLNLLCW